MNFVTMWCIAEIWLRFPPQDTHKYSWLRMCSNSPLLDESSSNSGPPMNRINIFHRNAILTAGEKSTIFVIRVYLIFEKSWRLWRKKDLEKINSTLHYGVQLGASENKMLSIHFWKAKWSNRVWCLVLYRPPDNISLELPHIFAFKHQQDENVSH